MYTTHNNNNENYEHSEKEEEITLTHSHIDIVEMLQEDYDDPDDPIGYIGNDEGKEAAYPLKPTRNAERKYKRKWCWECSKSFSSSTNLKEHQMTVHLKEADKFCPYEGCGYKTARISCYQAHIKRIHLKWKDFKCPFDNCDFEAYKLSGIDDHVNKGFQYFPDSPSSTKHMIFND